MKGRQITQHGHPKSWSTYDRLRIRNGLMLRQFLTIERLGKRGYYKHHTWFNELLDRLHVERGNT